MASTPQIKLRDGTGYSTTLSFTTNQESTTISGTVGLDTASVQISVDGGAWTSSPSFILYTQDTILVPNPSAYPQGFQLNLGLNSIRLRSIDTSGGVSPIATVEIVRVHNVTTIVNQIPTGVRVHRLRDSIAVLAAKPVLKTLEEIRNVREDVLISPATTSFLGFNIYASSTPAGTSGYFRVNETPVLDTSTLEEDVITTDTDIALWDNTLFKNMRLRITEEDEFGSLLAVRLDKLYATASLSDKLRVNSTFESYRRLPFIRFIHVRGSGPNADQFTTISDTEPLYYVVSGLYYDRSQNIEFETPYSQEVVGLPLVIDTTIRDMPAYRQSDVRQRYIEAIQKVNQEIDLAPSSTTRDVSIDPFSSEAERLWFLLDFVHRCQSILTLLQLDDADGDGTSDPANTSSYKIALQSAVGYQSPEAVQALIDQQFDKEAANKGKKRGFGRPAVGQVVIYVLVKPVRDVVIPADSYVTADADELLNLPSVRFRIGGSFVIPVADIDAYYNFEAKRWQIVVDIVCDTVGEIGNRAPGSITSITGASGVFVTNEERTDFGLSRETNAQLAARSILAYSAVDTGTEGGYALAAAEQVGVIKSKIVKSGDPLMMRDYDPVRGKHIGGKVDIWVQGSRERQITETFAFTFEIARDIQALAVDLNTLTFRVQDSRVTVGTPIIEILNSPSQGFGVRNVTTGESYDLTGVVVLDYQTFRINVAIDQPVTHIDDLVTVDYRLRSTNKFLFSYQPVRRVISVIGEISGVLTPTVNYSLYKTDDPLLTGESTFAENYLSLTQSGGKPSGNTVVIEDEPHTMVGFFAEPLQAIGINLKSIVVTSEDGLTTYRSPSLADPDYDIVAGTAVTPLKIVRTTASTIPNGAVVLVSYNHDENFKVTYVINDLLQQFQQVLNRRRHITGDVIAKQAINNPVDIETTIQLNKGTTRDKVDPMIRSNLSLDLNRKKTGQGSGQSDIIRVIDSTPGVDYQLVPFAKMAYADGTRKLREPVSSLAERMPALDAGGTIVYLLTNSLKNPTTDSGGLIHEHRGVFQDDVPMTLVSSFDQVGTAGNQAAIIGSLGASITGYSDDGTLSTLGFTDLPAERVRRTANRVLVSLLQTTPVVPTTDGYTYTVSYVVRGDSGSHDMVTSEVEFVELGSFTATYHNGV
jgi:hypothetical protein